MPKGRGYPPVSVLSDPLSTLEQFLAVASEGVFGVPLSGAYPLAPVPEIGTAPVPENGRHEQTLLEQTWEKILSDLKMTMLAATFITFLADTTLELDGQTAIIKTPNTFAHGWIENRMKDKLLKLLNVELHNKSVQLTELQCIS